MLVGSSDGIDGRSDGEDVGGTSEGIDELDDGGREVGIDGAARSATGVLSGALFVGTPAAPLLTVSAGTLLALEFVEDLAELAELGKGLEGTDGTDTCVASLCNLLDNSNDGALDSGTGVEVAGCDGTLGVGVGVEVGVDVDGSDDG